LSDQTEKPKGALPKGYEPNAQGEPQDQDKKIWDKYYNGEIELPDVVKELKHYRNSKDTELETSDEDQREKDLKEYEQKYLSRYKQPKANLRKPLNLKSVDLGKLNLRKHAVTKREELQAERKKYEKKYLTRYKQPKAKPIKSSNLKSGVDIGKLTLRQYVNTKRKAKQKEIKEYEQKYLSRYKQPKIQKKKASSSLYKPEIPKPKRDMKKERKEYEQKYLSRYKQPKSGVKKSTSWTQHDVALGRLTLSPHFNAKRRAKQDEIREYEKQYLSRYKQPKSGVKKSSNLKHDTDLGTLTLRQYVNAKRKTKQNEIREYEKQYLSRYKQPKPQKRTGSSLYKPEIPKPKLDMRKERKKYEQKYLSRYKQPKPGVKKSTSWTQHDVALGRLTLSPHFNTKRKTKQNEIREYEKQYLSRYKEPKTKKNTGSSLYKPEILKPKRDMERTQGIRTEISFTIQTTKIRSKEINILDAA